MAILTKDMIEEAKKTDPTRFLEGQGYTVKKSMNYLSIRTSNHSNSEVYRANVSKSNGFYVYCDKSGSEGGDLIKLAQELTGANFREAVAMLLGIHLENTNNFDAVSYRKSLPPAPPPPPRKPPVIPNEKIHDCPEGRKYLMHQRYISLKTIEVAEKCGFLRYADNAVFFCGYDEQGKLQSATRRAIYKWDSRQKGDLTGSDKSYAGIIKGNPKKIWIVEGGVDALALIDLANRQGEIPHPTIIVSGGANTVAWIEKPHIKSILQAAERITIAFENEKNEETQERTNKSHRKQARLIQELTGIKVEEFKPKPEMGKDLAELNVFKLKALGKTQSFIKDYKPEPKQSLER